MSTRVWSYSRVVDDGGRGGGGQNSGAGRHESMRARATLMYEHMQRRDVGVLMRSHG
jgi:hypothetical protein